MTKDVQNCISAVIAAGLALAVFCGGFYEKSRQSRESAQLTVGMICNGDKSVPYTANFKAAAEQAAGDGELLSAYNIPYDRAEEIIAQMAEDGAELIFTNSIGYGEAVRRAAQQYPDIQFCAATCDNADPSVPNYHTFMGEIYQGRYVCGVAAGAKLNEMIEKGEITPEQAVLGYVAAYPNAEVISGYTAFLLGARSQCPTAVMRVKYIQTWSNYVEEKHAAEELIAKGCVVLSHHTNTLGTALACENADMPYPVYHVGYNEDMIGTAPTAELIGTCIDWTPYMAAAVEAVRQDKSIESLVPGRTFGTDAAGGIEEGWVRLFDSNTAAAAPGTEELLEETITKLRQGKLHVFQGDYTGVDPEHPNDVIDLSTEYVENANSSAPTFHYVLQGVVIVEE